jgi:hypothetical protein
MPTVLTEILLDRPELSLLPVCLISRALDHLEPQIPLETRVPVEAQVPLNRLGACLALVQNLRESGYIT